LIIVLVLCYLGNINYLANRSRSVNYPWNYWWSYFFNSLTLSAYLNVFNVCSQLDNEGDILATINVLHLPVKLSFNTYVNLLPLNGVCFFT